MSDDLVEEPFREASRRVSEALDRVAAELKTKVEKAKSEALKKISQ